MVREIDKAYDTYDKYKTWYYHNVSSYRAPTVEEFLTHRVRQKRKFDKGRKEELQMAAFVRKTHREGS
jgi:hypothetical protein